MPGVFISYRSTDSQGFAGRLADDLSERFGDELIFRDDELVPGRPYPDAIQARLESCDALLAVIGPRWLSAQTNGGQSRLHDESDWVRNEIAAALAREIYVVPVLVGGAELPDAKALPEALHALTHAQAISLRDDSWRDDVVRLAQALIAHVPSLVSVSLGQVSPEASASVPKDRASGDSWLQKALYRAFGRGIKSLLGFAVMALIAYFLLVEYGGAARARIPQRITQTHDNPGDIYLDTRR